ncbi:MAG: glutaredoxin 3 [Desulfobulbus propionicus]|nr:MAG: glutaredoxin 3 [Desulfobulbus propionicus]
MVNIEVYTTSRCPYCIRAKKLLDSKGVTYHEIDVTDDGRADLVERAGGLRTVPQVFINGKHLGGCDDLYELDKSGELDLLLK